MSCTVRSNVFFTRPTGRLPCFQVLTAISDRAALNVSLLSSQSEFLGKGSRSRTLLMEFLSDPCHWLTINGLVETWMNWPMLNMMLNPILMQILGNMQSLQNLLLMQKMQNMQHLQIMQHMQKKGKICDMQFGQDLKLKFGCNFKAGVWLSCWNWSLVEILTMKFGHNFQAEIWSRFLSFA